ncbi:helix-turn-helix transcriptional regulator [Parapedomonas caeni]
MDAERRALWEQTARFVEAVKAAGEANGLPYIAAQSDLGDPEPMCDADGRPYAETSFRWFGPFDQYWRNRRLALDSPFLNAARMIAEPFYFADGRLHSWRATRLLDDFDCTQVTRLSGITAAIITPVHLPRGIIGTMVWASPTTMDIAHVFTNQAEHLHALALRLIASHAEAAGRPRNAAAPAALTRREVQCLRWAAAGKTDGEIGIILSLSISTVRFHLRNASAKLGATGRAQAIQAAAGLGFVGAR